MKCLTSNSQHLGRPAQKPHGWTDKGTPVAVLWDPINACHCSRKHWCVRKIPFQNTKLGTRPERRGQHRRRWASAKSAPKRKPPEASPRNVGDRAKLHHRSECDPQPCNLDEKYAKIKYKRESFSLHIYRCFCLSGFVSPAQHQIQNLFPPLLVSIFTVAEETTPSFDEGHSRGATECVSPFRDSESE